MSGRVEFLDIAWVLSECEVKKSTLSTLTLTLKLRGKTECNTKYFRYFYITSRASGIQKLAYLEDERGIPFV